ncbi:MAG: DEAD/DEAH box helicase [Chloroflexi bacterium]|nr:DEAD/DEAH box helicase [Chloroflexota bacterium]
MGSDLRYWGLVAKFVLELLARERFVPGLRSDNGSVQAVWLPVLEQEDQRRMEALAYAMPPACRAVFRERGHLDFDEAPSPMTVLQSFINHMVDVAVREWGRAASDTRPGNYARLRSMRQFGRQANIPEMWWQALWDTTNELALPEVHEAELTDFYKHWQDWVYQTQQESGASFRICFRLEPPDLEAAAPDAPEATCWTLRYFLQALDDPSLLVPAPEVWRERGAVLSYLNRRFDHPQDRLLEGLGAAARLCPPIRRSLNQERPEAATLTAQEAYAFLRETARLLEGAGFGVMVPPWWNRPDAHLHVRARLRTNPDMGGSGMLGMDALIAYDWELALGDETLTREEFERLAALKTPLVQVRGRWVMLQPDQVEAAIAFWEKHGPRGELRLAEALNLALGTETELDGLEVSDVELDDRLAELVEALSQKDHVTPIAPPADFHGTLRPYQVRGLSWLAFLRRWGFGACLADDMGLGKTIQAIALILHERSQNGATAPSLVICPTSLVGNWQREVARFAPHLNVVVHHGSGRAEGSKFVQQSLESDLVISTYGLVRRDIQDLERVHWANIILDEAQNIKNPLTKQAAAVRRLKGDFRLALTGTPVENRLSELWSIMTFLNPGYLGSLPSFRRTFAIPIERYQDDEATEQLRRLVHPFLLRRVKTDPQVIQDLPEKFEYKVYCNLTREQATLYEAVVQNAINSLRQAEEEGNEMRRRGQILAMLTRLKQVCNHPALFFGDGSEVGRRSGKLNRLREMLEEILEVGDRALVFTQFAQMGQILQRYLQNVFEQEVLFLHGGTPQKQRDAMLARFQEDPRAPAIFVLSLKAGGTGLNLMRANHVFHFDRWWNPAVENQATDRAYRIGQMRDVQVHKFICLGTLEERIDLLIESKRALADNIVGQGESWLTELSTEDLRDLITLRAEAVETE